MREILFRGKRTMNEEWVEGYYSKYSYELGQGDFICGADFDYTVYPDSVGQYTEKTDKNGEGIFEGDIVVYRGDEYGVIEYDAESARFCVTFDTWSTDFDHLYGKELEIIGNIHDSPELLK